MLKIKGRVDVIATVSELIGESHPSHYADNFTPLRVTDLLGK